MPERKIPPTAPQGGAYLLYLLIKSPLTLSVGSLGKIHLPAGSYVYVGSAQRSLPGRISRHRRLAETKSGNLHWHIDTLLVHPEIDLVYTRALVGERECALAQRIASLPGVSAPALHFGASDCRSGCKAHLFLIGEGGSPAKGFEKRVR